MRSLIAEMDHCYVCGRTGTMHRHHCFHGSANRKLADEDGMIVALCPECHERVHRDHALDRQIQEEAQEVWLVRYNGTIEEFRERYGRSFL